MLMDQKKELPQPPNSERFTDAEILKPEHTALLVIDMQNDFLDPIGKFAHWKRDIYPMQAAVPHVNKLVEVAHKAGVPVIYTLGYEDLEFRDGPGQWRYVRFESDDEVNSKKGTWGAEFYKDIHPQPGDIILEKHNWSAFDGKDPKTGMRLDEVLRDLDIQTIVVTGVKTEVCVDDTVIEGKSRGFFIVIPKEAVATDRIEMQQPHLDKWNFKSGKVMSEDEVIQNWPEVKSEIENQS